MPAGTWEITLVVIDDNNESASSSMTIVVKALPPDSILDSISSEIGSVGTAALVILFALVIGLSIFLMITRRTSNHADDKYQSYDGFSSGASPPTSEPPQGLFEQTSASSEQISGQNDIYSAPENQHFAEEAQVQQATPISQPAQINQGPALPEGGLPAGWSQEQWNYYGQQWLDNNKASEPVIQPTTTNTPSASVGTDMSNLLDDLDF